MTLPIQHLLSLLGDRKQDAHKGDFGHVLVMGGAPGMLGAVILAAQGACYSGAGLVSVATHPVHAPLVSLAQPNVMSHGVGEAEQLRPLLKKASVIIVGPGLGQDLWAQTLFATALETTLPLIIDADALNLLAQNPSQRKNWILTPHPGEAARLLDTRIIEIQKDRSHSAILLQEKYKGVMALKGAGTVVQSDMNQFMCEAGNPGMASAGMGDILSGIIGGLLAQHMDLFEATQLAVSIHAQAADSLAQKQGQRGLFPQDLLLTVRNLVNKK